MAADYLGLGESRLTAPYLLAENSATTVIDMLRAGKKYLNTEGIETDGSLYLTGYSQGGHVTMATHHEIEKNYPDEFSVTASAPLAGPYDLLATVDTVLSWNSYLRPVLMALLLNSYDHYYGWNRLSDFFQEPHADAIPGYFNGSLFLDAVNNRLPQNLDELLHADFRSDFLSGGESGIRDALRENSLLIYVPSAPVRLIHGKTDRTVPFFNGKAARDYYEGEGKTNVELVMIEGNHEEASAPALIAAIQWFEELRSSRK
jgi:pimeloyl-ACP methyl ester carboxylesterase